MMNPVLCFLFAVAVYEAAGAGLSLDHIEKLRAAKEKCRNEFGIDEDIILQYTRERILPKTETGKCAVACFLKEFKVIENSKVNVDRLKAIGKDKWEDEEANEKAAKIADNCAQKVSSVGNECEAATQLVGCLYTNAKEAGLRLPKVNHSMMV